MTIIIPVIITAKFDELSFLIFNVCVEVVGTQLMTTQYLYDNIPDGLYLFIKFLH